MTDEYYMNIALELANSVKGQTTPNPPVGAVIVKDGCIIGIDADLRSGGAHAEVMAVEMACKEANGATIYVTLGPCSHFGKTPPCTDMLIHHSIKRVVIATVDQHHQVSGNGIKNLQAAGIEVVQGILKEKADQLYEHFFCFITKMLPYITLKVAMTMDGKIATSNGDSKWITSEAAREDVHFYRHQHDAILVGIGTILADNPKLTTRLTNGRNPLRMILDTHLRTPLDANIVIDNQAPTWIFVNNQVPKKRIALYESHANVEVIQLNSSKVDIKEVLKYVGNRDVMSIFVEGGAAIHGSFLQTGYFNEYICYIAPKLLGGEDAKTTITGAGVAYMTDAVSLEITTVTKVGEDIKVIARKEGE